MRAEAFVPGHISCVFRPVRTDDVLTTGSLGFGIRTSLGCRAKVSLRDDDEIHITINGEETEAPVTRFAVEYMKAGRGFDIILDHDLPLEQGFGASASGTFVATLCVADLVGMDRKSAVEASHVAECSQGGGLGDLIAIASGFGVPIRDSPGADGKTSDSGLSFDKLTLIVFNEPLKTESVLSNGEKMKEIVEAGDSAVSEFAKDRTIPGLFRISNTFSEAIGLESDEIKAAISTIKSKGNQAGMCMLGNSLYTDFPASEARRLFPSAKVFETSSFSGPIEVIRKE
jgi:pantoate kinase